MTVSGGVNFQIKNSAGDLLHGGGMNFGVQMPLQAATFLEFVAGLIRSLEGACRDESENVR